MPDYWRLLLFMIDDGCVILAEEYLSVFHFSSKRTVYGSRPDGFVMAIAHFL